MIELIVPRARSTNLVVEHLPDETLVYDHTNHQAHCLNRTSAIVWKHCDGQKTVAEIAQVLEKELNSKVDARVVEVALDQLSKHGLLANSFAMPATLALMDRRKLVRHLGLAGLVALPVITSLTTPTAAQAQTCAGDGDPCTQVACCGNLFCVQGFCQANPP